MRSKIERGFVGVIATFVVLPLMAGVVIAGATSLLFHVRVAFPSLAAMLQKVLSLVIAFVWVALPTTMILSIVSTICNIMRDQKGR